MRFIFVLTLYLTLISTLVLSDAAAQEPAPVADPIEATADETSDGAIRERISGIFNELDDLAGVSVDVSAGVVTLSGVAPTQDAVDRAGNIAGRVTGVVTVENAIERDVSIDSRVNPALKTLETTGRQAVRLAPLVGVAALVFVGFWIVGWLLSREALWRRLTPNTFIAELVSKTVQLGALALGAVAALSLLDATAILGAILGAAGVLGLAVGFAVRDTIENYIASIMLSLRQPFRPNDYVVIDGKEGNVIRLTSRATILMTPDGNHLRIPNSNVFKAVILNYTTNPERRLEFKVGVDADDDPVAALDAGLKALRSQPYILGEPAAFAHVEELGPSTTQLTFYGWVDQRHSDFGKSRSAAIAAVKRAMEENGFVMPEPIYRLRVDERSAALPTKRDRSEPVEEAREIKKPAAVPQDTAPNLDLVEKVEEERRQDEEGDLLNQAAPKE